jgi:DNA-directed RNA polymerase specialized sigma24 family protein
MPQFPKLADNRVLGPADTALALKLVSENDLLRLKTIARLHARGLPPDVAWDDLLQEALTRMITGQRARPEGVGIVAFLAGIMRSLRADHLRRARRADRQALRLDQTADGAREVELRDPYSSPEQWLIAQQQLTAIEQLFVEDPVALQIIAGLGNGLSAEQIRSAEGISKVDYDSARKRMRRSLLREGLTCAPK